jgi:hypothetical protein
MMALTMTRTRTQTTLTKLVTLLANVNGELEFVQELLLTAEEPRAVLQARGRVLAGQRKALCATLKQFDTSFDPDTVGAAEGWWAGRRPVSKQQMARRYLVGPALS